MATSLGRFIIALDGATLPSRDLIGGKAWSVARMLSLGLRVPPAVVITTDACRAYLKDGQVPAELGAFAITRTRICPCGICGNIAGSMTEGSSGLPPAACHNGISAPMRTASCVSRSTGRDRTS